MQSLLTGKSSFPLTSKILFSDVSTASALLACLTPPELGPFKAAADSAAVTYKVMYSVMSW